MRSDYKVRLKHARRRARAKVSLACAGKCANSGSIDWMIMTLRGFRLVEIVWKTTVSHFMHSNALMPATLAWCTTHKYTSYSLVSDVLLTGIKYV